MDFKTLQETAPWDWPADAAKRFRAILMDPRANKSDRIVAAELAGLREFWDPIKRYWAEDRPENRQALHFLVGAKSTQWRYQNGVAHAAGPLGVDCGSVL
jgi:hypothetical protein